MFTTLANRIRQTSFALSPTDQAIEYWSNLSNALTLDPAPTVYAPYIIQQSEGMLELVWLDEREGHTFRIDLTACYLRHQATNPAIFYSLMQLHAKAGAPLAQCLTSTLSLSRTGAERLVLAWGMVEHCTPEHLNTLCYALIYMSEEQVSAFWQFCLHYGVSGKNPTPLYVGLESIIMGLASDNR